MSSPHDHFLNATTSGDLVGVAAVSVWVGVAPGNGSSNAHAGLAGHLFLASDHTKRLKQSPRHRVVQTSGVLHQFTDALSSGRQSIGRAFPQIA